MQTPKHHAEVRGWITPALRVALEWLTWPGIMILSSPRVSSSLAHDEHVAYSKKRAKKVDTFIAVCFMLELGALFWIATTTGGLLRLFPITFVAWRIIDVMATSLRVSLFDEFDATTERYVHSAPSRVIILGLLNYVELIICFAAIYAIEPCLVSTSNSDIKWAFSDAIERPLHLSWITQLTVGYGDWFPNSWLRMITWLQAASGLTILAILIARYMSEVPTSPGAPGEQSGQPELPPTGSH